MAERARHAVATRDGFTFAVSGGRTPWRMIELLSSEDMPWDDTAIYQVDERVAPAGSETRNLTHLLASLPEECGATVHPMPVEERDLEGAAAEYARSLPDALDLVHLGLGQDGHTASLVAGDPALDVADRAVAVTRTYEGHRRMTLTYATLARAREVLWLITGADKAEAFRRLREGDVSMPAARVEARRSLFVVDTAAAGVAL